MKKLVMIITVAMALAALLPAVAFAAEDIPVTGDWEVEYEVLDTGVDADGGTGVLRLTVINNSTDIMQYVSISYATGRDSETHQSERVTIAPTRDRIIDFTIPISASDAGIGLQLWVAMSTGDEDDVDGIGVVNGVMFGSPVRYGMAFEISTGTTTINQGESVRINFGATNSGNRPLDVKVYDQTGTQIYEINSMDLIFIEHIEYTPSSTTTYRFRAEAYRQGTDILELELMSSPIAVTVIEPTPEPTATPTPEPLVSHSPDATPTPTPVSTASTTPEVEASRELIDEELVDEAFAAEPRASEKPIIVDTSNGNIGGSSGNNTLWILIIGFLVIVSTLLIVLITFILKEKKTDGFA